MEGGVKQKECKRLDGALKCDGIIREWRQGTAVKEGGRQERFDLQSVEGEFTELHFIMFFFQFLLRNPFQTKTDLCHSSDRPR